MGKAAASAARCRALRESMGEVSQPQGAQTTSNASGEARDVASDYARATTFRGNSRRRNRQRVRAFQPIDGNMETAGTRVWIAEESLRQTSRHSRTAPNTSRSDVGATLSRLAG